MTESRVASGATREPRITFAGRAARLDAELRRLGLAVSDMRREQTLELQLIGPGGSDRDSGAGRAAPIERIEGPIVGHQVQMPPVSPSRLRYFLDGSQRTYLAYLVGAVPVVASVAAAAVLERDAVGNPRVVPGTLRLKHTWLAPRRLPNLADFIACVEREGGEIADPLDELKSNADYEAAAGDYGRLVDFAYRKASHMREELENELVRDWTARPDAAVDDGWIVVDGALRVSTPRALGLVKSFNRQYLSGEEAIRLFNLPPGHRTSAFKAADVWRSRRQGDLQPDEPDWRTLWYLRFWDATGRDARHALVRVETTPDVIEPAQIDELSGWLMTERAPRATADARWATLLYPVHYLEQILKRFVDADTRGWPGG